MNGVWLNLLGPLTVRVVLLNAIVPVGVWALGCDRWAVLASLAVAGVLALYMYASCPGLFRLLWQTRDWWRVRRGRVIVYHPPGYANTAAVRAVLDCCETHMASLERRFGFRLRGRLVVLLFRSAGEMEAVFRYPGEACALPVANAIAMHRQEEDLVETVRHELAHLYSARSGGGAQPLLEEGLATWLQGSWGAAPVGLPARHLLNESDVSLKELLDPDVFYAPENREITYALAASFTEFLIRRYGWERYGDASQSARRMGADYALWKHVGFPLADLERMWREELRAAANQSVP